MLKKILALMCLTLSIVLFCMAVSATDAETADINAIYVSGTVTEGGTGVISAPVSTLAEAYSMLGNSGTIYLMDTVSVSATTGDCFVAPAHTGKITITSANGYNGALDLTEINHFHFGGDTELNNIGIVANEVVLTADNHTLTMGEGLEMSSPSADTYRGGHTYCGAKIHLAAYAPCETTNGTCESADGALNVHSGEYWSVSAWYGDTVSVPCGETQIYLGKSDESDSIWLRYLCPGMFSSSIDNTLTSTDSTVTVIVNEGVNTLEAYRFTKNSFVGSMTVNWLLHNSAQGNSYAFIAKDFYPADDAECTLNVYSEPTDISATGCALLLSSGASDAYEGNCGGDAILADYCAANTHNIETQEDGRLICATCGYEQCRHLTTQINILEATACCTHGNYVELRCTDLCGEMLDIYYDDNLDANNHADYLKEYVLVDEADKIVACICLGCENEIKRVSVMEGSNELIVLGNANLAHVMDEAAALAAAYGDISISLVENATVYVPANYQTPKFDAHITISSGTIYFPDIPRRIYMNGDMTFQHVTFKTAGTYNGAHIYAQNHKLVLGEGIIMGNESTIPTGTGYPDCNSVRMYVVGGYEGATDNVMNTDITIRSGDYWFVGGFNRNASTNNGTSKITIGKTNDDDYLFVNYLTPFSTGDAYITEPVDGTIVVDGDVNVRWFYVTTMNKASENITYTTNIKLQGDINPVDEGGYTFDLRGTSDNYFYPKTVVNLFIDRGVGTAVEDTYTFFGHPEGLYSRDGTLKLIGATVNQYSLENYCTMVAGGHSDMDADLLCDECGSLLDN